MTKQILYKYLGTNGVIESPVHLEDIYYVRTVALYADPGKVLTDGKTTRTVVRCAEEEADNWQEIDDKA